MMTNQEIFTKVVTHLRKQGKKAQEGNSCLYRAPDGSKCAAGCLIADEHYKPDFEGRIIQGSMIVQKALKASGVPDESIGFVGQLQYIHDDYPIDRWEAMFARTAEREGLTMPPLESCE